MKATNATDAPGSRRAGNRRGLLPAVSFGVIMVAIVVIGASEGGLDPLRRIVSALPAECAAAFFVVVHTGPYENHLPRLLGGPGRTVKLAADWMPIEANCIYVPPPDHHMVLQDGWIRLNQSAKMHYTRPAADPLFVSAADAYGSRVMGVVLSGGDGDGALGLRAIKARGGVTLVQCPDEALNGSMPQLAIATDQPEALPIAAIAARVHQFCLADQPRGK